MLHRLLNENGLTWWTAVCGFGTSAVSWTSHRFGDTLTAFGVPLADVAPTFEQVGITGALLGILALSIRGGFGLAIVKLQVRDAELRNEAARIRHAEQERQIQLQEQTIREQEAVIEAQARKIAAAEKKATES